jgi:hypothetical protein
MIRYFIAKYHPSGKKEEMIMGMAMGLINGVNLVRVLGNIIMELYPAKHKLICNLTLSKPKIPNQIKSPGKTDTPYSKKPHQKSSNNKQISSQYYKIN